MMYFYIYQLSMYSINYPNYPISQGRPPQTSPLTSRPRSPTSRRWSSPGPLPALSPTHQRHTPSSSDPPPPPSPSPPPPLPWKLIVVAMVRSLWQSVAMTTGAFAGCVWLCLSCKRDWSIITGLRPLTPWQPLSVS